MLRLFGPGCTAAPIDVRHGIREAEKAVWIDLLEPTREEDALAERLIGTSIPTREEMLEIEPSSRLYEKDGVIFMTMSVIYGIHDGKPATDPVSFILTRDHLVTVRYIDPTPFVIFAEHVYADQSLAANPLTALARLLDAIVDRLADELERAGADIETISGHVFERDVRHRRRNPELRYEALMLRIGSVQRLLARLRESSVSTSRTLSFLAAIDRVAGEPSERRRIQNLLADTRALEDHSDFLGDNLTFLLDASLGMITLEQNNVMKIFSVFAVVFMPPTLIAGVYGMNFEHMPELKWLLGYPFALGLILASAIIPYLIARRRGWL